MLRFRPGRRGGRSMTPLFIANPNSTTYIMTSKISLLQSFTSNSFFSKKLLILFQLTIHCLFSHNRIQILPSRTLSFCLLQFPKSQSNHQCIFHLPKSMRNTTNFKPYLIIPLTKISPLQAPLGLVFL